MAQRPEVSLSLGIATAALVYGIYGRALPNLADIRVAKESNADVDAAERNAAWTSTAMVAGISLIARDGTIFILGGSMIIAMSWWNRHANQVIPELGKAVPGMTREAEQPNEQTMAAAEDYSTEAA